MYVSNSKQNKDYCSKWRINKYKQKIHKKEIKTMNNNYTQRGKKYIYSVERANEFIQRGYRCIETGFNAKQQKFFWAFNYNEVQSFYEEQKNK